jgi:signal transduction histidine kinase
MAILKVRNILSHVQAKKYQKDWRLLSGLMYFFFAGYVVLFLIIGNGNKNVINILAGSVFFLGSLFVYVVVRIGYFTIKDLGSSISDLEDAIANRLKLENELSQNRDRLLKQNDCLLFLTKNILEKNDLSLSIRQITEKTSETLDVERVSIWLYHGKTCMNCIDLFERPGNRHSNGQTIYMQDYPKYFSALETNWVIDASDVYSDPRTSEFTASYLEPLGITSMLDAPIHIEGKLKGVICAEHVGAIRKWTVEEQSFAGSLADIVAITLETFQRRKTQKELEMSLSLTQATIESTADGILVVNKDGKINGFNQQFLKMWRIPQSIIDGNDDSKAIVFVLDQLVTPASFLDKVKYLYEHPTEESSDMLEFKDGRIFERYSKPQISRDEIIGRVWSFRDVTRRIHYEAEIKKLNADLENRVVQRTKEVIGLNEQLKDNVDDLETANQELESFSYSVSHDLRAPLRAINGFIGVIEQKYKSALDEEFKTYLDKVSSNGKKMSQLIDDLLAFSRLGRKELKKNEIDVNELVAEIVEEVNIHEWNPNTKVSVGNLLPVTGDKSLLKQAFFNLLSNSIKYSRTKEAPLISINSYKEGDENIYTIKDNGVGFDMEYYGHLFKVFQRVHSPEEFEGTGVGLAIVQKIITRHGGRVWAEGKVNEGATFYIALPANPTEQSKAFIAHPSK